MVARGNCGLPGESITASLMHLLVLVHLRILNWLVVNSPRTMEQRVISDLRRDIDGESQISKNRIGYDEIECNRNKDTGNGLPALNGQSELFHSDILNSLIRNESKFRMNQISSSRIRTYDQSVNSRPLYRWATEEQREIRSHRVQFPFSTHNQYELEVSFVTPGTSS